MNLPAHLKTASIYTLGCRLNQADSALITDQLETAGIEVLPWKCETDLVIINSCAVTNTASSKTRQTARAVRRRLPSATVVVVGCDVKNAGESWQSVSEVNVLLDNSSKEHFVASLMSALSGIDCYHKCDSARETGRQVGFVERGAGRYTDRTRANLKIQEGCDFYCSYCIVPHVRGPARSRDWDDILREAEMLEGSGHKEITLTGVNIATFRSGRHTLADLLGALLKRTSTTRFRLSSTEPGPVMDDLFPLLSETSRICRFLHLPMQYGENSILSAMNRRYTTEDYLNIIFRAVASVDGICLGSDIIVGFPGETEAIYEACFDYVSSLPLSYLHVFSFSPRKGTPAAALPNRVPGDLAGNRCKKLRDLADDKALSFATSQIGRKVQIITENRNSEGNWEGWSDNYLRVEIEQDEKNGTIRENQFIDVCIASADSGRHVKGTLSTHETTA